MHYIEILIALCGVALLGVGYRKNERKMMALAGITLMVAGTVGHFADRLDQSAAAVQTSVAPASNP